MPEHMTIKVTAELLKELKIYAHQRDESIQDVTERAIRREMDESSDPFDGLTGKRRGHVERLIEFYKSGDAVTTAAVDDAVKGVFSAIDRLRSS